MNEMIMESVAGMKEDRGKPEYPEKTCPTSALSSTNATWSDRGLNHRSSGEGRSSTACATEGPRFVLICTLIINLFNTMVIQSSMVTEYINHKFIACSKGLW